MVRSGESGWEQSVAYLDLESGCEMSAEKVLGSETVAQHQSENFLD